MRKENQTMTEVAALELKKAIMRGDLSAGMRLIPAKLESELNLSRISIREAIRELVGSGLLESATHKGAYVADPLDIDEIRDIYEFRYQLEGKAAFEGSKHISEADIIHMEMVLEKIEDSTTVSHESFFLNQEFHMILYRASGWRYLIKVIERMYDQVMAFRSSLYKRYRENENREENDYAFAFDETYLKSYLEEHHKIVRLLREKKPLELQKTLVFHLKKQVF